MASAWGSQLLLVVKSDCRYFVVRKFVRNRNPEWGAILVDLWEKRALAAPSPLGDSTFQCCLPDGDRHQCSTLLASLLWANVLCKTANTPNGDISTRGHNRTPSHRTITLRVSKMTWMKSRLDNAGKCQDTYYTTTVSHYRSISNPSHYFHVLNNVSASTSCTNHSTTTVQTLRPSSPWQSIRQFHGSISPNVLIPLKI